MVNRSCIYRHYNSDGALLYVGFSLRVLARQVDHSTTADWFSQISCIEIDWFDTPQEAAQAEVDALIRCPGLHNISIPVAVSGNPADLSYSGLGRPMTFSEPQGEKRLMAVEWWAGPLHTDDVLKLIGQMMGTKTPSRGLATEWLGNRPKCQGRMRKTRSDKKV